ncbi:MAG: amidohydrolase [Nonomuraea sp.]|nr:amidohydrolase [Nonomuraea sp.]
MLTAGAAAALLPAVPAAAFADSKADVVFTNGYVYTVDPHDSVHQAIAITGGRITYVGTSAGAKAHVGKHTKVIDLHGKMLMPGLHDGHTHPMDGGQGLLGCDLNYAPLTVKQIQARTRSYAARNPKGWIHVTHWYVQAVRPAGTKLTRADLDAVSTERPIIMESTDGHTTLANTKALHLAKITAHTKNPPDGTIERDKRGEPTGVLQDGAQSLVRAAIPAPTAADDVKFARTALAALARQGVTTIMDAVAPESTMRAFTTLKERGQLTARVHLAPPIDVSAKAPIETVTRLRERYHGGDIRVRPGVAVHNVKLFMDGVLQYPAQTAGLLKPYLVHGHPGKKTGAQYWNADKLDDIVGQIAEAGFDPHVHAIGDRSVRLALDAFAALREAGDTTTRPTIAHAELVDPADIPRFGELDVVASMGFHWAKPAPDSVESVKPYIGDKRWANYEPEGDIRRHGGKVSLGSDWPVDPLDEWTAIKTVITRTAALSSPYHKLGAMTPHQRLSRAAALRAATYNGAYQLRQEEHTGSLEVGKLADLIVLDRNVMKVPGERIAGTRVLLTMVGGKVVYGGL